MKHLLITGTLVLAWSGPVFAGEITIPSLATRWWEAFEHPGLSAAIAQGLSTHPEPESALARIQAAEAGVAMARAGRRPELGVDAGFRAGREKNVETGGVEDDIDPLFGAARLSWELDLFGKAGAGTDAATARAGQSEADLAGIRLLLSLEIARAYIDVAHLHQQVALSRNEAEDTRTIFERAERRTEAGLESNTSRELTVAAWQRAQHQLMQTETDYDRAQARLTSLVGGTPLEEAPTSLAAFTLPSHSMLSADDRLMYRPDVVKSHLAWLEARGEATATSRARLPSLSLVVSAAGDGDDVGDPESWAAWAGPVVSFPVWNPGLKAKSRRARADEEAAEAALRTVSLRAVEEIDRAWAARSRSEEMIGHMHTRRNALDSVADTETRKRTAGLIQEDTLRQAKLNALQAARAELTWRAAAFHAHLTLIAALGG